MNVDEMFQGVRDALTVRRVFGEPIAQGGVTVLPVATVAGGAGGGSGQDASGDGGGGGAFGLRAKPAGTDMDTDRKFNRLCEPKAASG